MAHRLALALLILAAGAGCSSMNYGPRPGPGGDSMAAARPPTLDPNRKVAEQDCSKPVSLDRGNLRCR